MQDFEGIDLTEKEIEEIKLIKKFKSDILSYLNLEEFINEAKNIIDNCKKFSFRSVASKLTINKNKPIFVLKIDDEELLKKLTKLNDGTDKNINEILSLLSIELNHEIIEKLSKMLTDTVKDKNSKVFDEIPDEITKFVIGNIYTIRFNLDNNNVQLFYFF